MHFNKDALIKINVKADIKVKNIYNKKAARRPLIIDTLKCFKLPYRPLLSQI